MRLAAILLIAVIASGGSGSGSGLPAAGAQNQDTGQIGKQVTESRKAVRDKQQQNATKWKEAREKWRQAAQEKRQARDQNLLKDRKGWEEARNVWQQRQQDEKQRWQDASKDWNTRQEENKQKWADAQQQWQDAAGAWKSKQEDNKQKWADAQQQWQDAQAQWKVKVDEVNSYPHFPDGTFQVFIQDRVRFRLGGWSQTVSFKEIRKGMKLGNLSLTEKNASDLKEIIPSTLTFTSSDNHVGNLQQVVMSLNGKQSVKGLYNKQQRKLLIGGGKGVGAIGNVGVLAGAVLHGNVNEAMNAVNQGELNTGVLAAGPTGGVLADVTYFFNAFKR